MSNVKQILKKLNLYHTIEFEDYIYKMESFEDGRFFMNLIDEMDEIGPENADWKNIYNAMSKNTEVSEIVSCHSNSLIYKKVLKWIEKQNYSPKSFLELGSNNGLFSIALSKLWNNANILGIDYAHYAIKTSKELASKYKVDNSQFFLADINTLNSFKNIPKVDIIIAPFFFHEIISFQESNWDLINSNIRTVSDINSLFIAINRFQQIESECNQLSLNLVNTNFKEVNRETIKVVSDNINKKSENFSVQVFSNN